MSLLNVIASSRRRGSFDIDAQAIISTMVIQPDITRQSLINTTVKNLKTAGIWSKLDGLWMLAAHSEQAGLLNWKTQIAATKVSTPTFVTDRGFAGGVGRAINTGVNLLNATNAQSNSISFGTYIITSSSGASYDCGVKGSGLLGQNRIASNNSSTATFLCNTSSTTITANVSSSLGFYAANRSDSLAIQAYKNGQIIGFRSIVSTNLPNFTFYLCGYNNAGVVGSSLRRQAAGYVSSSLTPTQHASLYSIIQSYAESVGAGV